MFENIVILCPSTEWNKAYKNRSWIGDMRRPKEKNITIVNPVLLDGTEKLQELLRLLFDRFAGSPTLYITDDCFATKERTKKKDMLSQLAFSGRPAEQSVWVISQRYISVLKDLREQAKWVCMFYTKDRDSFEYCLRENDVVPAEERQKIKEELSKVKHRKLILKTDQHEPIRITKEPPPERPPILNVYKNFFPLCVLIWAVGIGIFMIYGRKTDMQLKMQPEIQPEIKQRPTDPFEMR